MDADPMNVIAFARNTTQVLNVVTDGGAVSGGKGPAAGSFSPTWMNAAPNGFEGTKIRHFS
jgi:hypothetical protein